MVKILSTVDMRIRGGMQTWVNDIKLALKDNDSELQIITDDKALIKADLSKTHLYYLTTPRRSLYDMAYHAKTIHKPFLPFLRVLDRVLVGDVENMACISHTVRNRVFKYYGRDAKVIYPCIHKEDYSYNNPVNPYWLSIQRVDKWKRIELQMDIARLLPSLKFIVVGKIYPQYKEIIKNAPENMSFVGEVEDTTTLLSNCSGFLTTAIDEDFGITPLEAMASGKPVVAVKEGGYMETIIDGETGYLVSPNAERIARCIKYIEVFGADSYKDQCIEQASRFDFELFKKEINKVVDSI
jgi:glycosyltransferase involved in cell wall biosynthesis